MTNEERKQLIEWLQIHDNDLEIGMDVDQDGYRPFFWCEKSEEGFSLEIDSENINQ